VEESSVFWIALLLGVLGAFVALLNFYLSFLRRYIRREDTSYRHVSGYAFVGSLFLYAAALIWFLGGWRILAGLACGVTLADTGGPIWFAIVMAVNRNRTT
jgi:hypothetical protein